MYQLPLYRRLCPPIIIGGYKTITYKYIKINNKSGEINQSRELWTTHIYPLITKGSLLAGYLEFYFAKQRGGLDPLSLNDQEKGTPPLKGNSRHMPGESLHTAAPWQCLIIITIIIRLTFGFFDIHLPRTQRCDESDRFEHPYRYRKSDFGVCANTDRVFFPARCVCQTIYLQMAI